jgi:predicted NBD/HSP70 family sugar kinase
MNRAATNKEVRMNNQKSIVNTLFRYGPLTKQELSERLGLSLPTISVINKNLAAKGLVIRGEKQESSGGRPPSPIMLVFDARLSIGLDISLSYLRIALVNLGPKMVTNQKYNLPFENTDEYWRKVSQHLREFIVANNVDESRLLGIGISIQAPFKAGHTISTSSISIQLSDQDLGKIKMMFQYPVEIHNEAKMASLSQVWGAGEENDVVYLMLSNGVGGSIITDHHILNEHSKNAEFGHMTLNENGPLCICGQHGCLCVYCSSSVIKVQTGADLETFFSGLDDGNPAYREIWNNYLHYLAIAINNIRLIFDTEVIIGGEMSTYIGERIDELRELLSQRNTFRDGGNYVRIGSYGEFDSAIGAAMVHIDNFLS